MRASDVPAAAAPSVLLIGHSLELAREPYASLLAARDAEALVAAALAQRAAGAHAIDLNAGLEGSAIDLVWAALALRPALVDVPLLLDAASPATIAVAIELGEREGLMRPLIANALPVGAAVTDSTGERALLNAAARARTGLVISPRLVDRDGAPPAPPEALLDAAVDAAVRARDAGVTEALYFDALAYPALSDGARCRRSLALLRDTRAVPNVEGLVAVGNVGYGAPRSDAAALRRVYTAAAVGAGATALLLPVEESATVRAVHLATGETPPSNERERWLVALAAATREGVPPPPAPPQYTEAAQAIFG